MQLRRAARLSLSLAALLTSAGCVSVGSPAPPPRGDAPQAPAAVPEPGSAASPAAEETLPLGRLPGSPPQAAPPAAGRPGPPAGARKTHPRTPAGPAGPHRRPAAPAPGPGRAYGMDDVADVVDVAGADDMDDLCEAAEGSVPPSVVDLCVGRYGR
ncbi:hypothetical protein [Streptomyces sp. NPDC051211]|uniref:hypothetical protein n=1 Tax=Streptomyces sp. NPDC051211 TaxID=3154643 RepID=UPI00344BEB67